MLTGTVLEKIVLHLYRRAALIHWKQTKGHDATYNNLIRVFEVAGYRDYADAVRNIVTVEVGKSIIILEHIPRMHCMTCYF